LSPNEKLAEKFLNMEGLNPVFHYGGSIDFTTDEEPYEVKTVRDNHIVFQDSQFENLLMAQGSVLVYGQTIREGPFNYLPLACITSDRLRQLPKKGPRVDVSSVLSLLPPHNRVRLAVEIDGELWVRLTTMGVRLEKKKNVMVTEALETYLLEREGWK
jgi:hypothetical protein